MTRRFFSLFFFFIILLSISVFGVSTTLIDDDFSYTDDFNNHGWQNPSSSCANQNDTPTNITLFNPSTNLGFGFNYTDTGSPFGCGFGWIYNLEYRNLNNFSQRTLLINYTYYHNASQLLSSTWAMETAIKDYYTATNRINIDHQTPDDNNYTLVTTPSGITGFQDCEVTEDHYGNHWYTIEIDFQAGKYHFSVDGAYKCTNYSIGNLANKNFNSIQFFQNVRPWDSQYRPEIMWLDNVLIMNSSEGLAPAGTENSTGEICSKNEDCDSGFCDGGMCGKAPFGFACDDDNDCLSGVCSNNVCTNPSLSQMIQYFVSHYFGSDTSSLNIVALFIILLITMIVGFYLRSVVLAMVTFYAVSLLMMLLGLLSTFFFFLFIIVGIIIGFVVMYLKSQN